jgi:hypothetical protein
MGTVITISIMNAIKIIGAVDAISTVDNIHTVKAISAISIMDTIGSIGDSVGDLLRLVKLNDSVCSRSADSKGVNACSAQGFGRPRLRTGWNTNSPSVEVNYTNPC